MVQAPSLAAIEAIRNPSSAQDLIRGLKSIKNEIVGHDQRKEVVVKQGILRVLADTLKRSKPTKRKRVDQSREVEWMLEDEVALQATLIVGSIAAGGPAFIAPLQASGAVPAELMLMLQRDVQPRLVVALLQALKTYARSWSHTEHWADSDVIPPSAQIFGGDGAESFHAILCQDHGRDYAVKTVGLSCDIISLTATDSASRQALLACGVLETLAERLATFGVPFQYEDSHTSFDFQSTTVDAPIIGSLSAAIGTLIMGSTYRAQKFCLSKALRSLFPRDSDNVGMHQYLNVSKQGFFNGPQTLLPPLHLPAHKSMSFNSGGSSAFPALSALKPNWSGGQLLPGLAELTRDPQGDADHASAVCSWLLYLARITQGKFRLAVLRLLALVHNALDSDPFGAGQRPDSLQKARGREKQMALIAVPLAVKLTQTASEAKTGDTSDEEAELKVVRETACAVLAILIERSKDLQAAAVEAGAIKHVCSVLKKTFDSVSLARPMWTGPKSTKVAEQQAQVDAACMTGSKYLPPEILHAMRCRYGALEALASIAKKEDVHRKAIVESGMVACIIDSLRPFPPDIAGAASASRSQASPKDGNTTTSILAACHAAQSMSRSVSLLRTSLIDAGIAKPIFTLLAHDSLDVQVAATDVCCNLLLDFSPMREDLIAAGVVKTLTEHTRRSESRLRLSSLWALKHLVLAAPRDIKTNTLEELGTAWLVNSIAGTHNLDGPGQTSSSGTANGNGGVSVGLSSSNAAGEQVDLLNPSTMDVDEQADGAESTQEDGDNNEGDEEDEDGEVMYDHQSHTHYQASQLRSTLRPTPSVAAQNFNRAFDAGSFLQDVREMEESPTLRAKRDEVAIQEQALDFVRNLLNGEDCLHMVDYLLNNIGTPKVFELLIAKLVPISTSVGKSTSISTGNGSGSSCNDGRPLYQPTPLLLSTIHIITHLANASPQYRQLLIAQTPLLQAWLPHFSHPDRRVRVICVWAVNSLTWIESEEHRRDARTCVMELRNVGIEAAVKALQGDTDLDVRERVKAVVRQMEHV